MVFELETALIAVTKVGKIAGVFLLGFVVLAVSSGVAQALTSSSDGDSNSVSWTTAALTHLLMLSLSIAYFLIFPRVGFRRFGLTIAIPNWVLKAFAASFAIGILVNLVLPDFKMLEGYSPLAIVLLVWIWASTCEEVLCRGLLQSLLAGIFEQTKETPPQRVSAPVALAALFFALMHLPVIMLGVPSGAVVVLIIAAFALGLIAGYVREQTGSLIPAIVVHSLFNISGSVVDWLMR